MSNDWEKELEQLIAGNRIGFLSTSGSNGPETSMAPYTEFRGDILLHLSGLARHTDNLKNDQRAGFMICAPEDENVSVLSLPRVSLQGDVLSVDEQDIEMAKQAYLQSIPDAETLFSFADFKLFRFIVSDVHWIGGFGSARKVTVNRWKTLFSDK